MSTGLQPNPIGGYCYHDCEGCIYDEKCNPKRGKVVCKNRECNHLLTLFYGRRYCPNPDCWYNKHDQDEEPPRWHFHS